MGRRFGDVEKRGVNQVLRVLSKCITGKHSTLQEE